MTTLHALLDHQGRAILCDEEGWLRPSTGRSDGDASPVVLAAGAQPEPIVLIAAPGRTIRVDPADEPCAMLGLCGLAGDDGTWRLRRSAAGPFLGFGEAGLVAVADESAAASFRLGDAPADGAGARLFGAIPREIGFDAAGLSALFARGERGLASVITALLGVLPIEVVRDAWSTTPELPARDMFYELVRAESRAKLSHFPGYTRDRLQDQIAAHGWSIGDNTYGYPRIMEPGRGKLTIGRYCSMADPWIVLGNHNTATVTSYPFVDLWAEWPGTKPGMADHTARDVTIGNDVWIGVESVILPGAVIGDGAVIGAGCVVRGTVEPYAICVGNPATRIKYRFDEPTRERLLRLRWWDWPAARVDRYLSSLLSPDIGAFIDRAEREDGRRSVAA